jgi:error-prone DNA polymerase
MGSRKIHNGFYMDTSPKYTELQVTTNFSFLRGASHPEEMIEHAAALGYPAIAITDRNSFAGIVRAHVAAKKKNIRLIVGCRLDLLDGPSLLAYPVNHAGYINLCSLLTTGNLRAEKGKCILYKNDVYKCAKDVVYIAVSPVILDKEFELADDFITALKDYKEHLKDQLYLGAMRAYNGLDAKILFRLEELSIALRIPLVATNDVHYHDHKRRELHDVLTCIREKCTIHTAGFRLLMNAERYLKPAEEMERLFLHYPHAIVRTQEITQLCQFSLNELKYEYPSEITGEGRTPQEELTVLAWEGAKQMFGDPVPDKVKAAIEYELAFIGEMNYPAYFLTVYDIVKFARSKGILCQGRGSAANSTICYCLGITSVDPQKFDLLFERFISSARNEPPDIDVDFEHERREEVMQYVFSKYGRDRAAIIATVTQQHQKGAMRDVAKVMGLSIDMINKLSGTIWEFTDEWFENKRLIEQGFNPQDKLLLKVLDLTKQYMGFPRQLGQHTGGFVITQGKLSHLCPIFNARMVDRTCIEWNKDDIDALGFMKIDVLALGMLTCIRKAFDEAKKHYGLDLTLANIPQDDAGVYEMIGRADTIGVFQIESRAQQSMLPRLKPKEFYDLVIEVAIVRPGPIQGDMVHPYLRRRNNEEKVEYPSKELEEILYKTLGVPLFQEQAMKIAIVAAGFTPVEADELRRSMATFKLKGLVKHFEAKLINGMLAKGYTLEYAQRVFKQLEGFGSYGFPESHAASFALLVYVSSWIKCYFPDVFACGLLNSMPMGFYQPAQIVIDARKHGVEVRPVDINYSVWNNILEEQSGKYKALRLGFRQIKGLREELLQQLILVRENNKRHFHSVNELMDAGVTINTLERLAEADAFQSMQLNRRQVLWELYNANDRPNGMFRGQVIGRSEEKSIQLPLLTPGQEVIQDYSTTSLSLKAHRVSFIREQLTQLHIVPANDLQHIPDGALVKIAGLVLVRQRPGTAGGVCFITLEDETGVTNIIVFRKLFDTYRAPILQARLLMVEGKLQRQGEVIHIIVHRCYDFSKLLRQLNVTQQLPDHSQNKRTQIRQHAGERSFPEARNFR